MTIPRCERDICPGKPKPFLTNVPTLPRDRQTPSDIATLKAWIAYWRKDADAGLPCTEASLADAQRAIERLEIRLAQVLSPGNIDTATPRPWRVGAPPEKVCAEGFTRNGAAKVICTVNAASWMAAGEQWADAALIVRAINAYDAMRDLLDDCATYFDKRSDVSDGDYGASEPNEEMAMLARIQRCIA